ncbi:MAG: Na(+)/H(+) antiporter subunit D, partial [Gammaproteobacteria bacterium]|nr:Na(+)/H(+) antiporter subunit D [Gammaproteobacteria bacterium]
MSALHPFIPFLIGALLVAFSRGPLRAAIALATPLVGGYLLWQTPLGVPWQLNLMGMELTPYRLDELNRVFGYIFHIAGFIAVLYALHVKDSLQQISGLIYAGSAIGAVFAGDLLSLFLFWELLALSSVFLIWARRSERSFRAGQRYLIIQVLSGVLLLGGALLHYRDSGSLEFGQIGLVGLSGWLIFLAFGIKCAFPLLHNWLTDAYPEATPTGTVFLSAFTNKVAVYALARGYPGT